MNRLIIHLHNGIMLEEQWCPLPIWCRTRLGPCIVTVNHAITAPIKCVRIHPKSFAVSPVRPTYGYPCPYVRSRYCMYEGSLYRSTVGLWHDAHSHMQLYTSTTFTYEWLLKIKTRDFHQTRVMILVLPLPQQHSLKPVRNPPQATAKFP